MEWGTDGITGPKVDLPTLLRRHLQRANTLKLPRLHRSPTQWTTGAIAFSICVSVAYVAWLLGHDPTRRVIVASYSGDFAAELHRQFRMVVGSEWYAALFPTLRGAKETGLELVTTQGGNRYATSVGGTIDRK